MITLYTIGFTKKSAEQFFELLKNNHISKLVDIRTLIPQHFDLTLFISS